MSLSSELGFCLASLDNSPINLSSRPSSPSSYHTFEFVLNAPSKLEGRSRRYIPSPLSGKYSDSSRAPSISRTSSFSGSIVIGRESRSSVNPSNLTHSPSFHPLPPISSEHSMDLRSFLDFTFQSFSLSTAPSIHPPTPPSLPPLPTLSQPLFVPSSPKAKPLRPLQLSSVNHPNSPYVPWDSPMRREIFRPLTPESYISDFSQYSRPYSRSGARAPEPTEIPEAENGRPHLKLLKMSQSIRNIRRSVKRNVAHVAKRITNLSLARSRSLGDENIPTASSVPPVIDFPPCLQPPSPTTSVGTSNTRSLAFWLESCRQDRQSRDINFMSLEDYERMGSWIDLPEGEHFVCGVNGCQFHFQPPDTLMNNDLSISQYNEPSSFYSKDDLTSPSPNSKSHSSPDLSLQSAYMPRAW